MSFLIFIVVAVVLGFILAFTVAAFGVLAKLLPMIPGIGWVPSVARRNVPALAVVAIGFAALLFFTSAGVSAFG